MVLDCAILEDGNVPLVEIFRTVGCQPRHEEFMGPGGIQQRPLRRVQSCFARTSSSAMSRISASTIRPSRSIGCVRFECACSLTVVCLIPRGICNMATCRFRFYQRLFPIDRTFQLKPTPFRSMQCQHGVHLLVARLVHLVSQFRGFRRKYKICNFAL